MKLPWLVKKVSIWAAIFFGIYILIVLAYFLSKVSFIAWLIVIIPLLIAYRWTYRNGNLYLTGLEGENDIKDEFKKFPAGYTLIRNIETSNCGNFDYVLLGPTGIWLIEVKSHRGMITFNGDILLRYNQPFEKDFLMQANNEREILERMIHDKLHTSIPVQPVIVFSSPKANLRLGLNLYNGIYVIQRSWLYKLVTKGYGIHLTDITKQKIVDLLTPLSKTLFTPSVTESKPETINSTLVNNV